MPVQSVFPEKLHAISDQMGEENYILVDVRQPWEYQEGHIPGALLIPLPELESGLEKLKRKPNLIFYCRSGARSMAAANWAEEHLGKDVTVVNMVGGFSAWEGKELRIMPRMRLFTGQKDPLGALARAMELEKGAQAFYLTAARVAKNAAPELAPILLTLADVEKAHAKVLYHRLGQVQAASSGSPLEPFEQRYAALPGDILEGGLSLDEALAGIAKDKTHFCLDVTDLALEIELAAYDLYKNLAADAAGDLEQTFLKLAQDELGHQRLLIRQFPRCGT